VASRFKQLVAFQRAVAIADELHACVKRWPDADQRTIGQQATRAADSVGANIAEAAGRWTKAERRRFLLTARASLYETEYWLDRARARGLRTPRAAAHLDEAFRTLNGLIRRHS
jgi:four helix bundle protein